jgi:hypothetical protein
MAVLAYIMPAVLILLGLATAKYAFRKQSSQEKLQGRHQLEMTGRGSRIHYFYIGCFLTGLGIFLLLKFW